MSKSIQNASIHISADEFLDLVVNVEESLVTLNDTTTATLRNASNLVSNNKDKKVVHAFSAILTFDTIYEYNAQVKVTKNEDGSFSGHVTYRNPQ